MTPSLGVHSENTVSIKKTGIDGSINLTRIFFFNPLCLSPPLRCRRSSKGNIAQRRDGTRGSLSGLGGPEELCAAFEGGGGVKATKKKQTKKTKKRGYDS